MPVYARALDYSWAKPHAEALSAFSDTLSRRTAPSCTKHLSRKLSHQSRTWASPCPRNFSQQSLGSSLRRPCLTCESSRTSSCCALSYSEGDLRLSALQERSHCAAQYMQWLLDQIGPADISPPATGGPCGFERRGETPDVSFMWDVGVVASTYIRRPGARPRCWLTFQARAKREAWLLSAERRGRRQLPSAARVRRHGARYHC